MTLRAALAALLLAATGCIRHAPPDRVMSVRIDTLIVNGRQTVVRSTLLLSADSTNEAEPRGGA